MYEIYTSNKKTEKKLQSYLEEESYREKLRRLQENPRKACGAHPLKGKLKEK